MNIKIVGKLKFNEKYQITAEVVGHYGKLRTTVSVLADDPLGRAKRRWEQAAAENSLVNQFRGA